MILGLVTAASLTIVGPVHAQGVTPPEQQSSAAQPSQAQPSAAQADPPDMATFVARVKKGMKGGKGSAQARKARVREIAREHAERKRQEAADRRER